MQELINTSVPNGLIPGTHGFATVAMSEGLAERQRIELEELSAYRHRVSTHGDAYVTENPVAWSHVIMRSGQHVVSRIAASPFDYTGRTNRLAHHLVFSTKEMAGCNGADILLRAASRLSVPWSGDPRQLPSGEAPDALLSSMTNGTSTWETLFGTEGGIYAQRLAWLLARDLSATVRPIAFLYDAATEGDGRRLLTLFAEVIALLPETLRDHVTFSTYADCLPQGTRCLLRGVPDQSATRGVPIVFDCRSGRLISGEDLLPSEPVAVAAVPVIPTAQATSGAATPAGEAASSAMSDPGREALPPPDDASRSWGVIIACSVVGFLSLIALVVFILLMSRRDSSIGRSSTPHKQDAPVSHAVADSSVSNSTETADVPVSPDGSADKPQDEVSRKHKLRLNVGDFQQDERFILVLDKGMVLTAPIVFRGKWVYQTQESWEKVVTIDLDQFDRRKPVIRRDMLKALNDAVLNNIRGQISDDMYEKLEDQVEGLDESVIEVYLDYTVGY